jgi:hypothetical protein
MHPRGTCRRKHCNKNMCFLPACHQCEGPSRPHAAEHVCKACALLADPSPGVRGANFQMELRSPSFCDRVVSITLLGAAATRSTQGWLCVLPGMTLACMAPGSSEGFSLWVFSLRFLVAAVIRRVALLGAEGSNIHICFFRFTIFLIYPSVPPFSLPPFMHLLLWTYAEQRCRS